MAKLVAFRILGEQKKRWINPEWIIMVTPINAGQHVQVKVYGEDTDLIADLEGGSSPLIEHLPGWVSRTP